MARARRRSGPRAPRLPRRPQPGAAAVVGPTLDLDAARILEGARFHFLMRNPFLGVLALGMPWTESKTVRSIACDGRVLYYRPDFVRSAPPMRLEGHFLHVLLHWALGHPWRGEGREARRWQSASDLSLVPLFLRSAYDYREILPLKASVDLARDRSTEEIYTLLPPPEENPPEDATVADVAECWQEPSGEASSGRDLQERWRDRIVQAAQSMAYTGEGREAAEEVLASIGRPRLHWRSELVRFLQRAYAQDYSWIPPNRRHLSAGVILPGTRTRSVGTLAIVIDTSGSIDPASARAFLSEVQGIADLVGGSGRLVVLEADDAVRSVREIRPGVPVPLEFHGRGGTDFRPAFEWASRSGTIRPTGLVYLTDGQGTFPERTPPFPVLWVMPQPLRVPFGAVVALPGL
jgi:predicted metal-dependent peptidase